MQALAWCPLGLFPWLLVVSIFLKSFRSFIIIYLCNIHSFYKQPMFKQLILMRINIQGGPISSIVTPLHDIN